MSACYACLHANSYSFATLWLSIGSSALFLGGERVRGPLNIDIVGWCLRLVSEHLIPTADFELHTVVKSFLFVCIKIWIFAAVVIFDKFKAKHHPL